MRGNAKIHHAAAFPARVAAWPEQNLSVFCPPTESPHPNKIDTLGHKSNYEWLRPEACLTFRTLKTAGWHILDRVGQQYTIPFTA